MQTSRHIFNTSAVWPEIACYAGVLVRAVWAGDGQGLILIGEESERPGVALALWVSPDGVTTEPITCWRSGPGEPYAEETLRDRKGAERKRYTRSDGVKQYEFCGLHGDAILYTERNSLEPQERARPISAGDFASLVEVSGADGKACPMIRLRGAASDLEYTWSLDGRRLYFLKRLGGLVDGPGRTMRGLLGLVLVATKQTAGRGHLPSNPPFPRLSRLVPVAAHQGELPVVGARARDRDGDIMACYLNYGVERGLLPDEWFTERHGRTYREGRNSRGGVRKGVARGSPGTLIQKVEADTCEGT